MVQSGRWVKVASKHYRHESGVEIRYRHNDYLWEVIGGADDGDRYGTLTVAVWAAVKEAY